MTLKESYELAMVIRKLRDETKIRAGGVIAIAGFLKEHTPKTFRSFTWFKLVERK